MGALLATFTTRCGWLLTGGKSGAGTMTSATVEAGQAFFDAKKRQRQHDRKFHGTKLRKLNVQAAKKRYE